METIRSMVVILAMLVLLFVTPQTLRAEEAPARGASVDERIEALDQRQRIIERNWELEKEAVKERAKAAPVAGAGKDGFTLKSADGSFQIRIRGYIQADSRFFLDDDSKPATDTFLLRRVRPIFEGTVHKHFGFYVNPDFGGGKTELQDAWLEIRYWPSAKLRAGKFKAPFGLERLQSGTDILFVERALPTNLVPNRDVGFQLHGDLLDGALTYAAAISNGVPDGGSADSDTNDRKDGIGRLFASPFRNTDIDSLKGLGLGVAGSFGSQRGAVGTPNLPSFKTPGQQTFFGYLANGGADNTTVADGDRTRISPQGHYYWGPLGFLGEYVRSSQEVRKGAATARLANRAWQGAASFVLTGDDASYKGVNPKNAFDPRGGKWGALEIKARYARLDVDGDAFGKGFADPKKSARQAKAVGGGLNWYLNRNLKIQADYEQTRFKGGDAKGDRETEKVILSRFQVAY